MKNNQSVRMTQALWVVPVPGVTGCPTTRSPGFGIPLPGDPGRFLGNVRTINRCGKARCFCFFDAFE